MKSSRCNGRNVVLSFSLINILRLLYLLKFYLPLILPEEQMNFKLSNIPGNSVYIKNNKFLKQFSNSSSVFLNLFSVCSTFLKLIKNRDTFRAFLLILVSKIRSSSSSLEGYPLQVRHKQDWGQEFILLLPQTAALPELDAGSGVIKPTSSFVIQNRQTSCSMWCPMYRARC